MIENQFYRRYELQYARLRPVSVSSIIRMAESLPQHQSGQYYDVVSVAIGNTESICTSVTARRCQRADILLNAYARAQVAPFLPAELIYDDAVQLIFPPVLLHHRPAAAGVIVDGTHRVYAAMAAGYRHIHVLAISTERTCELPGQPIPWSDVRMVASDEPLNVKFVGFDRQKLGPLFTVTLNGEWMWRSLESNDQEAS